MPSGGKITPIAQNFVGRVVAGVRYAVTGVTPDTWFGPGQPLKPFAPEGTGGRLYDYPFGSNLQYEPRANEPIGFADLRALADNLPLLRAVIETRKDQIEAMTWSIKPRIETKKKPKADPAKDARIDAVTEFLQFPDNEHTFSSWLRILLEDMLVIDAASIYPRMTNGGGLYSLDIVDGATIKRVIGADGRTPVAPDPAYQQVLHGVPAADFSRDELLYLPRNIRSNRLYGFSPVEQIVLTVNIALRRELATLEYYTSGSLPDSFGTLPADWSVDQIKAFQVWFDSLLSGNAAERRKFRFMPDGFKYQEAKQPPLKDAYDEWLARLICYAFSVPVTPFVGTVNRATGETMRVQASQEGLVPLKNWIKNVLDLVIWKYFGFRDLEFAWGDDDTIDPLQLAQAQDVRVKNGTLGVDEARDEYGLDGIGVGNIVITPSGPVPLKEMFDQAVAAATADPAATLALPAPEPAKLPEEGRAPPETGAGTGGKEKPPAANSGEVGKAAGLPFAKAHQLAPVAYPRRATRRAVNRVRTLWRQALKTQATATASAIRGTLFKGDAVTIEDFLAGLDFAMPDDTVALIAAQFGAVANQSGRLALATLEAGSTDSFDQVNQAALEWADQHAADLVTEISDATRNMVRAAIVEGTAQGLTNDEIAASIEDLGAFSDVRAQLIADTEIANANSAGALDGYRAAEDAGVPVMKEWLLGPNPCAACQDNADAGPIPLDDLFPSGDDAPAAHPNCECAVAPVVGEDA